ncbi:hypothetical protein [Xenorhabdus szentirmaii]|uniref:hypothetical protein n=1 Tax=Xenorhabdus szentirmaii TaxID=290112 RepID=UPI0019B3316A|nr:hypothetical protein [Xenorhabdus sp. CUL]MBD2793875.1 hypothetical protein [Xenorhabdus sp. CUL]
MSENQLNADFCRGFLHAGLMFCFREGDDEKAGFRVVAGMGAVRGRLRGHGGVH